MVAMDLGANEVLSAPTAKDDGLARPNPLHIAADPVPGHDRLSMGRTYVVLAAK
jgi:hypothetical protein